MSAMTTLSGVGLVAEDLDDFPEDGHRYELVDDLLLVSAAPSERHQVLAGNLFLLLSLAAPPTMRVLTAPVDVRLTPTRQLQPDLLVRSGRHLGRPRTDVPLLVVEVLSPSTRRHDLALKRQAYAEGGVPSYWICDPDEPSVTVLELREGVYVEAGRAVGEQVLTAAAPYAVELVPARLLD